MNIKGPKGDSGNTFVVLDIYETLEALKAAHPTGQAGEAYFVGTPESKVVYIWGEDAGDWVFIGELEGPTGTEGPAGAGVPLGGAKGQVLVKNSNADYDTQFVGGFIPTYVMGQAEYDAIADKGQNIYLIVG